MEEDKEAEEEVERIIEQELLELADGDKKDLGYILGRRLLLSKDPTVKAEAWKELNKLIEHEEDPNNNNSPP